MPYKKTYARKRTYPRRKYPTRKSTLAREVRLIKRTIKPEVKFHEPAYPTGSVTGSPTYFLLNDVPQGTQAYQRIGSDILLKSIQLRGAIMIDAGQDVLEPLRYRCMLVWIKQPDGYALDDAWLWNGGTPTAEGFTSYPNRKTFKVIYDKKFVLANTIKPIHQILINKKLNKTTVFENSGTGDLSSGALYWVVFQLPGYTGTPTASAIELSARLFYTDC